MTEHGTPAQTIGPFFGFALPTQDGHRLAERGHPAAMRLHGVVYDGDGEPIPDALLEIWQPDERGRLATGVGSLVRDGYSFTGWGRVATDAAGRYSFDTVRPGVDAEGSGGFISMVVFARGLLDRLFTRVYLPEVVESALAEDTGDQWLRTLDAAQRASLTGSYDAPASLRFDIRLQGESETVFLKLSS